MHFKQRSVNKLLVHVKATWKPELLISESLTSSPPHHAPLPALFFQLELKKNGRRIIAGLQDVVTALELSGSFTYHYLLWMAVSAERLRGKDTNSAAGMPRAGRTNRRVEALWRTTLVFSLCSVLSAADPPAIVQQRAASLHMFWFIVQSRCVSPPAHSCNRPCWLTCDMKIISTVISINAPQQCKISIYHEAGCTAAETQPFNITITPMRAIQEHNGPLTVHFRIPQSI